MSLLMASLCSFDHMKVVPFFRRLVRGCAMCVNPGMNGHW